MNRLQADGCPPYLELGERSPNRAVVYLHESKLDVQTASRTAVPQLLAQSGAWVVLPELPMHGDRADNTVFSRHKHRSNIVEGIAGEISLLLDAMKVSACAVVGLSLGGVCALGAAMRDNRIERVAVLLSPVLWSPQWQPAAVDPEGNDWSGWLGRVLGTDFLVVLGDQDEWAPPDRVLSGLPPARAWEQAGGRFRSAVLPKHPHWHSRQLAEQVRNWYFETAGAA